MAKDFAKHLYNSQQWQDVRNSYYRNVFGLCERCGEAGEIVHHIIPITMDNINDVYVTLNWDNLMLLCRECHSKEHRGLPSIEDGLMFNEEGDVVNEVTYNSQLGNNRDNY